MVPDLILLNRVYNNPYDVKEHIKYLSRQIKLATEAMKNRALPVDREIKMREIIKNCEEEVAACQTWLRTHFVIKGRTFELRETVVQ